MAHRIAPSAPPAKADPALRSAPGPVSRPRHRHCLARRVSHLRACSTTRSFDLFAALE